MPVPTRTARDARDVRGFLEAYEKVRREEAWGGDDLDLPFHPRRHRNIWRIRQRTFLKFERLVRQMSRGVALDVGAGNCWMTRYLAAWGFEAIAVDVNVSVLDGLAAGGAFITRGAVFRRVLASMDELPFGPARAALIVANASFHYARDFRATLQEFQRVLAPGGTIAVVDTPFYDDAEDGERMLAERAVEFGRRYGMTETMARWSRFLTFRGIAGLAASLDLACSVIPVWPGPRRTYQEVRARLGGRPIARFPIVLLTRR